MRDDINAPLVALTIAGFDPSGGAGVVADIKTFTALALAARRHILDVSNTTEVRATHQTAHTVRARSCLVEFQWIAPRPHAAEREIYECIASVSGRALPSPVVDPVFVRPPASSIVTLAPALSGNSCARGLLTRTFRKRSELQAYNHEERSAARRPCDAEIGTRAVLVKGGLSPLASYT